MDGPDAVISIIEKYPDFKAMYGQIYDICQNVEGVMDMFSKELRELDRNTVQLMIDEMQEELNQKKQEVEQTTQELTQANQELEQTTQELTQANQELTQTKQGYQDALARIAELENKLKSV